MTDQPARPAMTMREIRDRLGHARPDTTPDAEPARETKSCEELAIELMTTSKCMTHGEPDARQLLDQLRRDWEAEQQPAPVDRVAILREVADECDDAGAAYTARAQNEHAGAAFALMETFLRKANEAEYVATPCDFVACEPGGEPCSTHERLMAHAEGEHELCEPDCGPSRMADEAQQPEAEAPTEEQIVREHVTTVHLIGEQLAAVEGWLWERLADVRNAASEAQRPTPTP